MESLISEPASEPDNLRATLRASASILLKIDGFRANGAALRRAEASSRQPEALRVSPRRLRDASLPQPLPRRLRDARPAPSIPCSALPFRQKRVLYLIFSINTAYEES